MKMEKQYLTNGWLQGNASDKVGDIKIRLDALLNVLFLCTDRVIMAAGDSHLGCKMLLQGERTFTSLTLEIKYDATNGSCICQICEKHNKQVKLKTNFIRSKERKLI